MDMYGMRLVAMDQTYHPVAAPTTILALNMIRDISLQLQTVHEGYPRHAERLQEILADNKAQLSHIQRE